MSKDSFNNRDLDSCYEGIGLPLSDDWASTTDRQGWLRVTVPKSGVGKPNFYTVAKKGRANHITAIAKLEFDPKNENQQAGLVLNFDLTNWYFFYLSHNVESDSNFLQIQSSSNNEITNHLSALAEVHIAKSIQLKITVEEDKILFYYSNIKHRWHKIGPSLNTNDVRNNSLVTKNEITSIANREFYLGMGVCNASDKKVRADFDYFKYLIH